MRVSRDEVVTYLRIMAETTAILDREWLFHAAHLIKRDAETTWTCRTCQQAIPRPDVTVTLDDVMPQMGDPDE